MAISRFLQLVYLINATISIVRMAKAHSTTSSASLFNYIGIPPNDDHSAWSKPVNATGQLSQPAFDTNTVFFGPLGGIWTWTSAIYESDPTHVPVWISEQVWLRTDPEWELLSSASSYAGCLFVFHDIPIATVKAGQSDNGSCTSIFSMDCIDGLQSSFQSAVLSHQNESYDPSYGGPPRTNQTNICRNVARDFSMPSACANATGTSYNSSSLISVRKLRIFI